MSDSRKKRLPHFLFGASPHLWRRLTSQYGGVDPEFRSRAALIQFGMWSLAPERCWEAWRFGREIERIELHPAPVFIVGYWQSGHSLMHHLMAQDPQFATTSLLHCALPLCWRTVEPVARSLLRRRGSKTRYVDSLPMSVDGPQGDDLAMASLSELSIYHGYSFPRSYETIFRRSVLWEGVSSDEMDAWKRQYQWLLQKVAWDTGRPRLLSRNAAHSGRIQQLLELFPQAKFIHLHRNPFRVYAAQEPKWRSLCGLWALQTPNVEQLVADTLRLYPLLMQRLFEARSLIPRGQYCEVRYEDLLADRIGTLRRVYAELSLPGFESLESRLAASPDAQRGQLAGHDVSLTDSQIELVQREWRLSFETLGYSLAPADIRELAAVADHD